MDRWVGKVAIVTGASSGIGAGIAEELAKAGVLVVGLARRLDRLEKLSSSLKEAKGKFYPRECDVRKEEDIINAFKWVNDKLGGVDIVVNNAGVGSVRKIIDADGESLRNILDVNVLAMAISIQQAVTSMKKRDVFGCIININSIMGHFNPAPNIPVSLYSASKFAVTALTETVRKELAADVNNKIKITSISPGLVETEIFEIAGHRNAKGLFAATPHLDAKDVADAVIYVLGTRPKVQVTELMIRPINETL